MNFGKTITVEMLVKHDVEFEKKLGGSQWDGTWINTLFGIEGRFLIRHGDTEEDNYQQWEFVYCETGGEEHKFRSSVNIPGGEWAHIAVVVDGSAQTVTLYQNGESVASGSFPAASMYDIDLTATFSGWAQDQAFALGRSYDNCRDFCGAMSEVRVWNKALTGNEINVSGHFYSVDPASSGLVAYWKMDDGEGDTIKDYTSNGNDLKGYRIINTSDATGKTGLGNWELGMTWQEDVPVVAGSSR